MSDKKCNYDQTTQTVKVHKGETKAFCSCRKSEIWPFCDTSHASLPGKEPKILTFDRDAKIRICLCSQSENQPFCDNHCCHSEEDEDIED